MSRSVLILTSGAAIAIVLIPLVIYRAGMHTERRFDVYDIANGLSKDITNGDYPNITGCIEW